MFDRRHFILALSATLLGVPLTGAAQRLTKRPRVGVLLPGVGTTGLSNPNVAAFEKGLRDHG
jgi:hypothetical protein